MVGNLDSMTRRTTSRHWNVNDLLDRRRTSMAKRTTSARNWNVNVLLGEKLLEKELTHDCRRWQSEKVDEVGKRS